MQVFSGGNRGQRHQRRQRDADSGSRLATDEGLLSKRPRKLGRRTPSRRKANRRVGAGQGKNGVGAEINQELIFLIDWLMDICEYISSCL